MLTAIMKKKRVEGKTLKIAALIDQTNIGAKATAESVRQTCVEAKTFGFRGVCVDPQWIRTAKMVLKDTMVKVICLVDPPIGDSSHEQRMQACKTALEDGADELDVVISIPDVKHERWQVVYEDISEICAVLPTKVIIGSGYLTDAEIARASELAKKAGAICVKTATAKDPLEHRELKEKFFHLKIMKKAAPGLMLKVSGNIQTQKDAKEAIRAGADIIGTSYGVSIIKKK